MVGIELKYLLKASPFVLNARFGQCVKMMDTHINKKSIRAKKQIPVVNCTVGDKVFKSMVEIIKANFSIAKHDLYFDNFFHKL